MAICISVRAIPTEIYAVLKATHLAVNLELLRGKISVVKTYLMRQFQLRLINTLVRSITGQDPRCHGEAENMHAFRTIGATWRTTILEWEKQEPGFQSSLQNAPRQLHLYSQKRASEDFKSIKYFLYYNGVFIVPYP